MERHLADARELDALRGRFVHEDSAASAAEEHVPYAEAAAAEADRVEAAQYQPEKAREQALQDNFDHHHRR